jgi:hypothetical protein
MRKKNNLPEGYISKGWANFWIWSVIIGGSIFIGLVVAGYI